MGNDSIKFPMLTLVDVDEYLKNYWTGILDPMSPFNDQGYIYPFSGLTHGHLNATLKAFRKREPLREFLSSVAISIGVHTDQVGNRDETCLFVFGCDFISLYRKIEQNGFKCGLTDSQITYRGAKRQKFLEFIRSLVIVDRLHR